MFACGTPDKQIDTPIAENAVLDISSWDFQKDGNIPLSGKWEFYWQQLIAPGEFDSTNIQHKRYFNMPGYWNDVQIDSIKLSNEAFATYRLNLISNRNKRMSIFISEQMTAYKFWLNGKLVAVSGRVSSNKEDAEPNRTPIIVDINLKTGNNELVFQISNFNHRLGGFYLAPTLGSSEQIHRNQELQRALDMFLIGSLFLMGVYFIMLYFIRTFISGTLFIGSFSILLSLRTSLTGTRFITDIMPNLSWSFQYRLEYLVTYMATAVMLYFLNSLYKEEINKKLVKIYLGYTILISSTLVFSPSFFTKFMSFQYVVFILVMVYILWSIIVAAINKKRGAKTIAVTLFIYVLTIINDILYYSDYINWSTELAPIGTFILVLGQIMALTGVFANLLKDHEVLTYKLDYRNYNLDSMVREKTKKLREQQQSLLEKGKELQIQNEKIKTISDNLEEQNRRIAYSERKIRNLLQMLPEAIFQIDSKGKVIYANDEFYRYIKYEKESLLNISQIVNYDNVSKEKFLSQIKKQIKETKIIKNLSLNIIRSDNTQFPALFSVIEASDSDELAYRCMFMDITSQVEDEEKIVNAYKEISLKNKDITDSLKYAYTMQKAVMPDEKIFSEVFSEYFIINKPQSIVSGDFYYISKVDNKVVFALSDCTGHGVPGGFMTMLGITLLNELYGSSNEITSPEIALAKMRTKIIESLSQKNEPASNKDGMDIILCILDTETLMLEFASANQPLLILRGDKIITVKGDSMPVGIYLKMKEFSLKQVQLNKGDSLYVFSDGIVDSFGGDRNRKLYIRGLRSIIEDCYTLPMKKQAEYIEETFEKWKGDNQQIDDILVMGIKV